MSDSLYALTHEYEALMEYADSTDPEDQQVFEDTLESVMSELAIKTDAYAVVIHDIQAKKEMLKREVDFLKAKIDSLDNNEQRMKDRMADAIRAIEPEKREIRGEIYTFKLKKNGGKQGIEYKDTVRVPDRFMRVVYEKDTDKIREALEKGEKLNFAALKERGEHIEIN